jgi:hypothetical protein
MSYNTYLHLVTTDDENSRAEDICLVLDFHKISYMKTWVHSLIPPNLIYIIILGSDKQLEFVKYELQLVSDITLRSYKHKSGDIDTFRSIICH